MGTLKVKVALPSVKGEKERCYRHANGVYLGKPSDPGPSRFHFLKVAAQVFIRPNGDAIYFS